MAAQIYFDDRALRARDFFELQSSITTVDGRSYDLEDWIGRGGNAAVFQLRDRATGDLVAGKFLLRSGSKGTARFKRECALLKSIADPHITAFHGEGRVTAKAGKSHKTCRIPFIIMELAESNLSTFMRQRAAMPLNYEQYSGQFRGLASALARLHDQAVHRDIKPENILISGERWLLSDYGLCSYVDPDGEDLTGAEANVGPKYWLSPEANNRRLGCEDRIDKASDVFQLASIFWYVATGRHPLGVVTKQDWIGPKKLFKILFRSLFHDQTKRPQCGRAFFRELVDALDQ